MSHLAILVVDYLGSRLTFLDQFDSSLFRNRIPCPNRGSRRVPTSSANGTMDLAGGDQPRLRWLPFADSRDRFS